MLFSSGHSSQKLRLGLGWLAKTGEKKKKKKRQKKTRACDVIREDKCIAAAPKNFSHTQCAEGHGISQIERTDTSRGYVIVPPLIHSEEIVLCMPSVI